MISIEGFWSQSTNRFIWREREREREREKSCDTIENGYHKIFFERELMLTVRNDTSE